MTWLTGFASLRAAHCAQILGSTARSAAGKNVSATSVLCHRPLSTSILSPHVRDVQRWNLGRIKPNSAKARIPSKPFRQGCRWMETTANEMKAAVSESATLPITESTSVVVCSGLTGKARKAVAGWLFGCSLMTATVVVVGAVTRLTESGLSMVRWEPIKGMIPPRTEEEWEKEFEQYKQYPEYHQVHTGITLSEFKSIFFWEYLHRNLGRTLGVVYGVPALYLLTKKNVSGMVRTKIILAAGLLAFQGCLGWYMVKSGLEAKDDPAWIPRVSQYRLAAHLCTALLMYSLMLSAAFSLVVTPKPIPGRQARVLWHHMHGTVHLTFLTALSGAFVAGLDAGLVYNSFPKFANKWIPDDIMAMEPKIRNLTENPTTVQFIHRCLGVTTVGMVCSVWALARPVNLPRQSRVAVNCLLAVGLTQVSLGIATLLMFVPVDLAATHQAGSLALLGNGVWLMHELSMAGRKIGAKPPL